MTLNHFAWAAFRKDGSYNLYAGLEKWLNDNRESIQESLEEIIPDLIWRNISMSSKFYENIIEELLKSLRESAGPKDSEELEKFSQVSEEIEHEDEQVKAHLRSIIMNWDESNDVDSIDVNATSSNSSVIANDRTEGGDDIGRP